MFSQDLETRLTSWLDDADAKKQMIGEPVNRILDMSLFLVLTVGDCFLKFAPFFKMYSNYCSTYDPAARLLDVSPPDLPLIS